MSNITPEMSHIVGHAPRCAAFTPGVGTSANMARTSACATPKIEAK